MVRFSFSGHELMALPQGALYWPARNALLVADLHLEKASWFARIGQMLPPYDSIATLADLAAIVAATAPEEIWCLGDSFHDRHGCDRLPPGPVAVTELTAATRGLSRRQSRPGLTIIAAARSSRRPDRGLVPPRSDPSEPRPTHRPFPSKLRIQHRGRHLSRRCFVATPSKLLSRFGYSPGDSTLHPEIARRRRSAEALVPLAPAFSYFLVSLTSAPADPHRQPVSTRCRVADRLRKGEASRQRRR